MLLIWVSLIEVLFLFTLVVKEHDWLAALSLLVFASLAQYFFGVNILAWVKMHPSSVIGLFAVYTVLGVVWAFAKWFFFVRDKREQYVEMKAEHQKEVAKLKCQLQEAKKEPIEWSKDADAQRRLNNSEDTFNSNVKYKLGSIPPSAKEHKKKIVSWISYWPVSLVWTMLRDFLTSVFKRVYSVFAEMFQKISNSQFKDVKGESHD